MEEFEILKFSTTSSKYSKINKLLSLRFYTTLNSNTNEKINSWTSTAPRHESAETDRSRVKMFKQSEYIKALDVNEFL